MTQTTSTVEHKSMSNKPWIDELKVKNQHTIPTAISSDPEQTCRREPISRFPPLSLRSDSGRIRDRLLNRLGIEKEIHVSEAPDRSNISALRHSEDVAFDELLKADYGMPDRRLAERVGVSRADLATSPGKDSPLLKNFRKGVAFDASVKVLPIPSRTCYSNRIRNELWMPPEEIQQNAARNSLEFAAEGWNWENVAEDSDMVLYEGELVHPIHFMDEFSLDRRFCRVMQKQR